MPTGQSLPKHTPTQLGLTAHTVCTPSVSACVVFPSLQVVVYCKGADSAMLGRCIGFQNLVGSVVNTTSPLLADLDRYSGRGLRTLVVAKREFTLEEFRPLQERLQEAVKSTVDREQRLAAIYEQLEQDLELLGISAVEDRLQEGVPRAMKQLRAAGIRVWVLTGDKMKTAINISLSAGHISKDTIQLVAAEIHDEDRCRDVLSGHLATIRRGHEEAGIDDRSASIATLMSGDHIMNTTMTGGLSTRGYVLVMDGVTAGVALHGCRSLLRELIAHCNEVLCCRLSPLQKALIVEMVKLESRADAELRKTMTPPITLAIGDGANDVSMITTAHVGVGILGKEGRQAARSSDYAFGRFELLARLVLVHGHYSYRRIAMTVQYFFYKNVVFIMPVFLFGFYSLFSAQTLYDSWLMLAWNLVFTSLPILAFGMFEKDVSEKSLDKYPGMHRDVLRNRLLSSFWCTYWQAWAVSRRDSQKRVCLGFFIFLFFCFVEEGVGLLLLLPLLVVFLLFLLLF
eukprot:m.348924 g.348924  ORF g.348924 m.348924 type:complete len:513 (+) comp19880_c0_seq4:24-1562(+)